MYTLVLKARHLSGSITAFCIDVPEQVLGWFPLDLGWVIEDESSELPCTATPNVGQ